MHNVTIITNNKKKGSPIIRKGMGKRGGCSFFFFFGGGGVGWVAKITCTLCTVIMPSLNCTATRL